MVKLLLVLLLIVSIVHLIITVRTHDVSVTDVMQKEWEDVKVTVTSSALFRAVSTWMTSDKR